MEKNKVQGNIEKVGKKGKNDQIECIRIRDRMLSSNWILVNPVRDALADSR